MTKSNLAVVESGDDVTLRRRTYQITPAQDEAIQSRSLRTGNSWSATVRQLIARGLEAEADDEIVKARMRSV